MGYPAHITHQYN